MKISLRMQGIQRNLLNQKHDDSSPENISSRNHQYRSVERNKFVPVLVNKNTIRRSTKSSQLKTQDTPLRSLREVSPLGTSSTFQLGSVTSSQFFKNPKSSTPLVSSNSLEVIKPVKKIIESSIKNASTRKQKIKSPKKIAKSSLADGYTTREVSRIRDNTVKSKTEVEKLWRKVINASNGIESSNPPAASYTVFIGKGNNSPLIKKLFMSRSWWKIVETKDSANLIWSQWKDKQIIADLNCLTKAPILDDLNISFSNCINRIQTANSKNNNQKNVEQDLYSLNLIRKSKSYVSLNCEKIQSGQQRLHNKLEFNQCLSNKKGLYSTMKNYYEALGIDIFEKLPITFNVLSDSDEEYNKFLQMYHGFEEEKQKKGSFQNIWIIKPGEFSNRGNGITVCQTLDEISAILKPAAEKSYIIQKYIEKPLLIYKRKFDIRCYAMISSINGIIQGYFYLDGYLRTTSKEYNCKEISNPFIHLTNDAIQKHSAEYGKFENGNKLSYREFQRYLDHHFPDKKVNFTLNILPQIKEIVKDTMKASFLKIDKNKRMHCMEIFGYDFMIDRDFKPWLIEVNTNPCLELASLHLRTIIPAMVENALKITVDSLFPPPIGQHLESCPINRFELIFHQNIDGNEVLENLGEKRKFIE